MAFVLKTIIKPTIFRQINKATTNYCHTTLLRQTSNTAKIPDATPTGKNEPKLFVSESCLKRLREICKDDEQSFLRVTVEGGGCSGFQYKFDLDNKVNADDMVFGEENAKVVIDKISLDFCAGSTVDYHVELIRSGFRMQANPIAEAGCSCGASFAIKLD